MLADAVLLPGLAVYSAVLWCLHVCVWAAADILEQRVQVHAAHLEELVDEEGVEVVHLGIAARRGAAQPLVALLWWPWQ